MSNKHVKVINGRRYYYESIRKGKKVTSRYLGPVDARVKKERQKKAEKAEEPAEAQQEEKTKPQQELPEDSYIG